MMHSKRLSIFSEEHYLLVLCVSRLSSATLRLVSAQIAPLRLVARACGQAVATAHMGAHARNIGRYTRKALSGKLLTEELEWQKQHAPNRLYDYIFNH